MSENPRDKFVRLAVNRVNRAIKDIKLIGNLSNKSNYSYSEEDIEKIFRALNNELKLCRQRFASGKPGEDSGFTLG